MADGINFNAGVWSYTKGPVTVTLDPKVGKIALNGPGVSGSVQIGQPGTWSQTLPGTNTTISLNTDGNGAVSIGAGLFKGTLEFSGMAGKVSITGLSLSASKDGSMLGGLITTDVGCTASLKPIFDQTTGAFNGFKGAATCEASSNGIFGKHSAELFDKQGTFNSGDFFEAIPGVSSLKNGIEKQRKFIDETTLQQMNPDEAALGFALLGTPLGTTGADLSSSMTQYSLGSALANNQLADLAATYVSAGNTALKPFYYAQFSNNLSGASGQADLVLSNGNAGIFLNGQSIIGSGDGLVAKSTNGSTLGYANDSWASSTGLYGSNSLTGSTGTYLTYGSTGLLSDIRQVSDGEVDTFYTKVAPGKNEIETVGYTAGGGREIDVAAIVSATSFYVASSAGSAMMAQATAEFEKLCRAQLESFGVGVNSKGVVYMINRGQVTSTPVGLSGNVSSNSSPASTATASISPSLGPIVLSSPQLNATPSLQHVEDDKAVARLIDAMASFAPASGAVGSSGSMQGMQGLLAVNHARPAMHMSH